MEADWYVDPLGRFEGRFFDGSRWTHQVSDRGALAFDPDWPPGGRAKSGVDASVDEASTRVGSSAQTDSFAADVQSTAGSGVSTTGVVATGAAATGAVAAGAAMRTSSMAESPTKAVATVATDARDLSTASSLSNARGLTGDRSAPEPIVRDPLARSGSNRRWLYALGALLLLAGLALALLPRLIGGDDTADNDAPAAEVTQAAEDVVPDADQNEPAAEPEETTEVVETGDEVTVGAVTIRNGQTTLGELATWHRETAISRGANIPEDADCWFAKRGDVAEQAAFCGPVGVDDQGRLLYDQIAVLFDNAGPQIVSASTDRDSLIPDIALEQGRELVDRAGNVVLGAPAEAPERGIRVRGN